MSNVIQLSSVARKQQAIREKACQWVVRLSAGASARDLQDLHAWLDENPEHVKSLLEVASMWDQVAILSELSAVFPLDDYLVPHSPKRPKRSLLYSALAALVLVFVLQGPLLDWIKAARGGFGAESLQLSYETRIGQQSTVVLPDGSEVLLNTNSRIDIAFSAEFRDIILHRGEGHFKVAKSANRPFRVFANGGIVQAIGTAFTVQQLQQQSLEVTVLEGEVSFTRMPPTSPASAPAASSGASSADAVAAAFEPLVLAYVPTRFPATPTPALSLTAGESVRVNERDTSVVKQTFAPDELESRLAWRDGMLFFEGDRLEAVIGELSRYTAIRIDVDAAVRDIEVLGVYRAVDIESTLQAMSLTFNLEVERINAEHIVLKAAR